MSAPPTSSRLTAAPIRAARWSATHPGRAIALWFAFVAAAVSLAILIPTQETTAADYRLGESGQADAWMVDAQLDGSDVENVLITGDGRLDRQALQPVIDALRSDLSQASDVAEVAPVVWSPDGEAALISASMTDDAEDADQVAAAVRSAADQADGLHVGQTGDLSTDEAISHQIEQDLSSAEGISLPVTLVLMLLAFGALVAAGLPVLMAVTSVAATIGISAPLSHLVHAEPTVSSMIVLIGMAVGVDYSLMFLKRERREREAGHSTIDAVEIAAHTSGHAILVSGLAVVASMAGLFVIGGATFNSLATGAILVVAIAVLGSITVLPALLSALGRWVDRPRVPLLWRLNRRIGRGGVSGRILSPVVRHPAIALLVSMAALLALAAPAFGMKLHQGNLDTLPPDLAEVQTLQSITDHFPSEGASADVVVRRGSATDAEVSGALETLEASALASADFVRTPDDAVTWSPDRTTAVLHLVTAYDETDDRAADAVDQLRGDLVPDAFDQRTLEGAEVAVGGGIAEGVDFQDLMDERLPIVIGAVLLLTLLMMGGAFRSAPIAAVTTLLNVLSIGAAFGVLTLVFQHGWMADRLDFTSPGFVIDWIPVFVLVVLVGLSMDYHVFVLSRVRELVDLGYPARVAVRQGVIDTAGVVTSAAAVMVSVFAIFATLSMLEMKMMGVGLAAAILIDATVVRLVMLPALLTLLGERAWWPRRTTAPRGEAVEVRGVDACAVGAEHLTPCRRDRDTDLEPGPFLPHL